MPHPPSDSHRKRRRSLPLSNALVFGLLFAYPLAAHASAFDTGITNVQTLFTGTIVRAVSLITVVLGGLGFAFGEPGAKKELAMLAIGIGVALMAANVISRLWSA